MTFFYLPSAKGGSVFKTRSLAESVVLSSALTSGLKPLPYGRSDAQSARAVYPNRYVPQEINLCQ